MSEPRLIIFDCDGTIVDSQHIICAAMEMAFAQAGLAAPLRESVLSIVGLSLPQAIAQVKRANSIPHDEALLGLILEGYKSAFHTLRLDPSRDERMFPGAADAIFDLAARDGVLLGIATGKSRRGVDRLLARHGMEKCFATIRTADDAPSKPHPAMVEQAMAQTGAAPGNTVMIGDTTYDIEMALGARTGAIGVAWGYHPVERLKQAGAHHVAEDYPGLMAYLTDEKTPAPTGAAE